MIKNAIKSGNMEGNDSMGLRKNYIEKKKKVETQMVG